MVDWKESNMIDKLLTIFLVFFTNSFLNYPLKADCCGKMDIGPAYLHIDVLESNHTIKSINLPAIKADATVILWKGLCLKPTILYGTLAHTELLSGGCGIGHYTPIGEKCSITPSIGCNFTQFKTTIHYEVLNGFYLHLKERFRSTSPYLALDGSYCFAKGWRICATYQYVWSRTHTHIKDFEGSKSSPKGSNYAVMLENDVNDCLSINLGAAYNSSLTKEKHGLRGYGIRLGISYWFNTH